VDDTESGKLRRGRLALYQRRWTCAGGDNNNAEQRQMRAKVAPMHSGNPSCQRPEAGAEWKSTTSGPRRGNPAAAVKRALAEAVAEAMEEAKISKVEMARRMGTSRSQLDRVLDPGYTAVQLDTLIKAASAVGRDLRISLKRLARA
jgi:antitoxin HicB